MRRNSPRCWFHVSPTSVWHSKAVPDVAQGRGIFSDQLPLFSATCSSVWSSDILDEQLFFHIRRSDFLHDVVSIGRSLSEIRPSRSSHSINLRNRRAKKREGQKEEIVTKTRQHDEKEIFYTAALPRIIYDGLCFTEWRVGVERTSLAYRKPFLNKHSIVESIQEVGWHIDTSSPYFVLCGRGAHHTRYKRSAGP